MIFFYIFIEGYANFYYRSRRRRKTEKEEDEQILKDEQGEDEEETTLFTQSPTCKWMITWRRVDNDLLTYNFFF